ncbi:MAG: hypothetical protein IJ730_07265 [Alphaproteobacteria bacterium]|nr:hypothetical protein [Alphaproteobacteria bacterium]
MNISVDEIEQEEYFTIEDVIVSYSNIEITHVNDNKAPMKVIAKRIAVWLIIISMLAGIFVI